MVQMKLTIQSELSSLFILLFLISTSLHADYVSDGHRWLDEDVEKIIKRFDNGFADENSSLTTLEIKNAVLSELCHCKNEGEQSPLPLSQLKLMSTSDSRGLRFHPSPIPDVSDACTDILEQFALSVSNFTYCAVTNARPITVCQDCMDQYLEVESWFKNISSKSGDDCGSQLFNKDYLLIVQSNYKFVTNFWQGAECANCYSKEIVDKPTLCNFTLGFFHRLRDVAECLNNTEIEVEAYGVKNISVICDRCRKVYLDLNDFYEEMNTNYNNRLCYDVIDAMNITRHSWSSTYMCNRADIIGLPVLLLSGGICFLPILYYTGNRLITHARESKLVLQKRMSFVQTSYSSVNLHR